jgi:hypothetical protein
MAVNMERVRISPTGLPAGAAGCSDRCIGGNLESNWLRKAQYWQREGVLNALGAAIAQLCLNEQLA